MRANIAALILLPLIVNATLGQAADNKPRPVPQPPKMKADFSSFEQWGLQKKSYSIEFAEQVAPDGGLILLCRINYVLEFEKDVQFYDLENLKLVFFPPNRKIRHIFFGEDNVAINAYRIYEHKLFGEVSGVRGEAFRIVVEFVVDADTPVQRATKLVVRPG
jgi:hypothetical protein